MNDEALINLTNDLREGVHGILKEYGIQSDMQRSLCALEISALMLKIVSKIVESKKKEKKVQERQT